MREPAIVPVSQAKMEAARVDPSPNHERAVLAGGRGCLPEAPCGRVRWRWHPPLPGCGPGEELDWPGAHSVPRPTPGATRRCPGPVLAFTRMLNQAGIICRRKAGKWAAQEAALEEIGQVRSRLRCRSAEGHTRIK